MAQADKCYACQLVFLSSLIVMPAEAGISCGARPAPRHAIPASAGMTVAFSDDAYFPVQFPGRFSTKAAMPSFWSAVPNSAWNSRRSNCTPCASVVS